MDNAEKSGGFGDESSGADLLNVDYYRTGTNATDATSDGSEFSPEDLAIIHRKMPTNGAPLPKGVQAVKWQPPQETGLQHSSPIFETERDIKGALRVSGKGFISDNCHFRSWQEANGVAATFASETVEKEVDGHRMTVAIGRCPRLTRPSSSDGIQRASIELGPDDPVPDIERQRALRRSSSEGEESRPESALLGERGDAEPSVPSVDVWSQLEIPPLPLHRSEEAVSDSEGRRGEGVAASPASFSNDAFSHTIPSMPRRPKDGVASSHARQPRPGRSLSSKVCPT